MSADGLSSVGPGHSASTDESVVGRGSVVPPADPRRLTSVSTDFPAAEPDRLDSELFYEAAGALLCCAHRPHIPRLVAELRDRGGQFEALGD
ncbi:hypothetical protein BCA37_10570 [Mycobacterium sp. djl-10]|nr:hypothetical protein BCA37_10570 [Mycobacterium sp. djl-10]